LPVLALIAASALVAAHWDKPVVDQDDYPQTALLKEKSAAAILEILTDPEGKVIRCEAAGAAGDKQLAQEMCDIAKRKAATPARDADGKPAYGYSRTFASLSLPGTSQDDEIGNLGPNPDIDFSVASIPAGISSPVLVSLTIAVDKGGKATECEVASTSSAAFGAAGCQQIKGMSFDKLTDANGNSISYVRPMTVRFSLDEKS
jgi:hypothetical protein